MTSQYSDPYEEWKAQGRPGGSFQAWQASQAAPQVSGGSVAAPAPTPQSGGVFPWLTQELQRQGATPPAGPRSGGAFPWLTQELQRQSDANAPAASPAPYSLEQMIRQGAQGQSEDFARFNSGTVQGWGNQYYDAAASAAAGRPQFRSMRGAEGFFDKPTECPPGMGPSGPNESDPCTSKGYSTPAPNPLQNVLAGLQGTPASAKAPWTPTDPASSPGGIYGGAMGGQGATPGKVSMTQTPNPAGLYGGIMGGQNLPTPTMPTGPVQSSLTSLMAPMQGFVAPTTAQSGLTNMLKSQQKRPGQWF